MAAWYHRLDKLDACFVYKCETGIYNIFVKMSFEKARITLDYLYNRVLKNTAELRKLSTMPKVTFYLNLKKLNQQSTIKRRQGSGRPRALNQNDGK